MHKFIAIDSQMINIDCITNIYIGDEDIFVGLVDGSDVILSMTNGMLFLDKLFKINSDIIDINNSFRAAVDEWFKAE